MHAAPTRTRLIRDEHDRGCWTRAVRTPDPRLRGLLHRDLLGFEQERATFSSWLEPPRAAYTLIVDLEGSISLDGVPLPHAWIAGLSDRYAVVGFDARYASLDLELTPLGAWSVLGLPLAEIEGETVTLEDAFGDSGRRLVDQLYDAPDWESRFDVLERFLIARADAGPRPTPAVAWALRRLWETEGRERVDSLAAELGCSRRYLHARFREQVGLAPKTVARLIRFGAVRRRIERAPARWADIAYDCGYADQSHLSRDFRELAGTTPGEFVTRLLPGYGGVMGDGVPFVQD
jgi:AraC-like DNA-binding protein